MTSTTCLYSTVKNVSGKTMKFGFLPPHGWELDDDEERTVFGNITEAVSRYGQNPKRAEDALLSALANGYLVIKSGPAVILYDSGNDNSRTLDLHSGSLRATEPCFSITV